MTVLVLGASRGIGLALVQQYLAAGERVIATARDDAALAHLSELGADTLRVDVTQPASVSGLNWLLDGEKIDIALYVAGRFAPEGATFPPTQQVFDALMHTNVMGAMQALPQVAPWVENAGGQFAFLSSARGHIGSSTSSCAWVYHASKAALNKAVVSAQPDYPRAQFLLIHPGWVRTDMGGPEALLGPDDSAHAICAALAQHKSRKALHGCADVPFLNWDGAALDGW